MTFEEWKGYQEALSGHALYSELECNEAYKAGQESIRPLVEKMREALKFYYGDDINFEVWLRLMKNDCGEVAEKALAEATRNAKFNNKGE